ncbi:carbohydrate ABC transporter permease [Kitasatospora herbaricolor]|uniref:carbohydrate ABC transporter permease n=1 Tax=Kitasatospora herbaricolor TaxID=68217 RepID=UPI0036DB4F5F
MNTQLTAPESTVSTARPRTQRGPRPAAGNALLRARRRALLPFAGPAILLYIAFVFGPTLYSVWISFHETSGYGDSKWVGVRNYTRLLSDDSYRKALFNTLELLVIGGGCTFVLSFALTMVLREMRGRLLARNVLFFPNIVNAMVFGVLAGFLFNPDGLVNTLLHNLFGVTDPPKWLSAENTFPMILATIIWTATGYYTTIIMAGVDQIPAYFYEECALSGANAWQRLRYVTIPLTWEVLTVCALLWTISSVKIFELVLVFGGNNSGLPPTNTWPVSMYSYAEAFGGLGSVPRYGMASASALTSLLLVALIVVVLRRAMDRRDSVQY